MVAHKLSENVDMVQYQIELHLNDEKFETIVWFDKKKYVPHINNPNLRDLQARIYNALILPQLKQLAETISGVRQTTIIEMVLKHT